MKTLDIVKRAGQNLRQAKMRTFLTSTAISIGAFVIMTSLAFGVGINKYVDTLIGTNVSEQTIQITKKKMEASFQMGGGTGLKEYKENYNELYQMELINSKDIDEIKKIDGVKKVKPFQMVNMKYFQLEGQDKKWQSSLNGYDAMVINEPLTGKLPALKNEIGSDEIVIPETYLKDLNVKADEIIGKKVKMIFNVPLTEQNMKKAGIDKIASPEEQQKAMQKGLERAYEFKVVAVGKNVPFSLNMSSLLINTYKHQEIGNDINFGTGNYDKYISVVAVIEDNLKPEEAKKRIESKTGLSAMTARELQQTISQVTNILQIIVTSFGVLALIVSIFGIINTMYVSVLERTSQIGLMKALGMRGKHVAKLFRYEAAWVGFIGGAVGIGLSWIIGIAINPWLSEKVGFKVADNIFLLQYEISQALILLAVLILVAIISGFLPARKAAKLDPIEALRTE